MNDLLSVCVVDSELQLQLQLLPPSSALSFLFLDGNVDVDVESRQHNLAYLQSWVNFRATLRMVVALTPDTPPMDSANWIDLSIRTPGMQEEEEWEQ